MICPFCLEADTNVRDSRNTDNGKVVRRRRYCGSCGGRFTTFERLHMRELVVIKRSGAKRPFDRTKISQSVTTAIRKRNFSEKKVEEIIDKIILELESGSAKEIPTRKIGNLIMQELAKVDPVAYIRFASVYKDFNNIEDFTKFISKLRNLS